MWALKNPRTREPRTVQNLPNDFLPAGGSCLEHFVMYTPHHVSLIPQIWSEAWPWDHQLPMLLGELLHGQSWQPWL